MKDSHLLNTYELLEEFLFLKLKSIITTLLTEENFASYNNIGNDLT